MGQMCSITKHCTLSSNFSASLARPQPTASSLSSNVYLLSCLYVVSSDALRSSVFTDFDFKGSCNQGKKVLDFYYSGVTRRHSFGKCVLTTLLKKYIRKKTSSSDKVSFISPVRYADWLSF